MGVRVAHPATRTTQRLSMLRFIGLTPEVTTPLIEGAAPIVV